MNVRNILRSAVVITVLVGLAYDNYSLRKKIGEKQKPADEGDSKEAQQ